MFQFALVVFLEELHAFLKSMQIQKVFFAPRTFLTCGPFRFPEERDSSGGLQVGERLGRVERLLETLVAKISQYEEEEPQNNILTPESIVLTPNDSHPSNEIHAVADSSPYLALFDNTVVSPTMAIGVNN